MFELLMRAAPGVSLPSTDHATIRYADCSRVLPPRIDRKETMKISSTLLFAIAALASAPAFANADLAQKKNCMACHAIDKKVVGPAYKEVAAKYAGQKDAVDKLAEKVVKGGSGVWGPVPMPANAQVTDAEAKQLVQWIMTLK
jgi:cytochrome c